MSKKPEEHKSGKAGIPPGGGWRMGVDVGGTHVEVCLTSAALGPLCLRII